MTFFEKELSRFFGQPVELFTFRRGDETWRYTSSDANKIVDSIEYSSETISRGRLERNQVAEKNPISITTAYGLPFLNQFIASPPSDIITVTIQRFHETDPDLQVIVAWLGRVTNVNFGEIEATISCEPTFTAIKRPSLRRFYQTTCPHVLYGNSCKVLSENFELQTIVESFSGVSVISEDFALQEDQFYTGGYLQFSNAQGHLDRRFIAEHIGNTINLNLFIPGLGENSIISVFPGCDHLLDTCENKFNNILNYGGFPWIPELNPMGYESVF